MDEDTPWYLIYTHFGEEAAAVKSLEDQRLRAYAPQIRIRKPNGKKFKYVPRPLFPRYVFGRFDYERSGHDVTYSRGVIRIVDFGGSPAAVGQHVIDEMLGRSVDGYVRLDESPVERKLGFRVGEEVRITTGVWEDFTAVFRDAVGSDVRVELLLAHLGKTMPLTLPGWGICPTQTAVM